MHTSHVSQYRKQIGLYDNRSKKTTEKSIMKAIRKARNSDESIRTHRNKSSISNSASSTLKVMVILAVTASVIVPAGAMENGVRNTNGPAESTFCYVGSSTVFPYFYAAYCSGFKINNRQIVSAKHCGTKPGMHIWAKTRYTGWEWASHRKDHPDPKVDLTIFTFPKDLAGYTYCVPLMTRETRDLLEKSPKNICGLEERVIIEGRGERSSEPGALFSYPFDFSTQKKRSKETKITLMKGMKRNNQPVCAASGDSGSPIVGCNPKTGNYEVMGFDSVSVFSANKPWACGSTSMGFVDTAYYPELRSWILNNTQPCIATDGYSLQPNDFFKTSAHSWDRCKIPEKYDTQAGISKGERCSCYYKNFQTPPNSINCPQNNKGEAECIDIHTFENVGNTRKDANKIIIKNNCNGCVKVGFSYKPFERNGYHLRLNSIRVEKGATEEIKDEAEYIVDKSKGIRFFRRCGRNEIKIPKFFETPPQSATESTTKPKARLAKLSAIKQNKPIQASEDSSIKFAAGAAFAAIGVATLVAVACTKGQKKVQFNLAATNPPVGSEGLALQPLRTVNCHNSAQPQ